MYMFLQEQGILYIPAELSGDLIFRIFQNLPYRFGEFENGLDDVFIQYLVVRFFFIQSVVPFIYGRMEKILLSISPCDDCVCWGFVALLVCLLIILFVSFLSCSFFCKTCFNGFRLFFVRDSESSIYK